MSRYHLFQDTKRCVNCRACEVQCKVNKQLPAGPRPTQIVTVGPKMVGGLPRAAYIFMSCFHCAEPWCVAACPTKAMQKRPEDGIVFVDHETCVGCKACVRACPWGAPQWHKEARKVVKCDYCKDRVDQGLKPACVTVCISGSLSFGEDVHELTEIRRIRHAEETAQLG